MVKPIGSLLTNVVLNPLRERYKLTVLRVGCLRRYLSLQGTRVQESWRAALSLLLTKYYLGNQINKKEMSGSFGMYERQQKCLQIFSGATERKRQLGRPRRRLENNIEMDIQETEWGQVNPHLDWDLDKWRALVNEVMNIRVPQNVENFLTSWGTPRFSRRNLPHGVIKWKHTISYYTGIENSVAEKFQLKKKHNYDT